MKKDKNGELIEGFIIPKYFFTHSHKKIKFFAHKTTLFI
ncbi:hypothetical protein M33023_06460 [Candidatus Phytoplasma asteris]|uniref:Uncharacterized protein n=1 Tax=Candidatus Phytoplasma asteris TaxID=85620 RepID=A0ABZ2YFU5_9MOLU